MESSTCKICGKELFIFVKNVTEPLFCGEHLKSEVLTDEARQASENEFFLANRLVANPAFKYNFRLNNKDYNRLCLYPDPGNNLAGWAKIAYDFNFWPLDMLEELKIFLPPEYAKILESEFEQLEQKTETS